jgi:hypothetical protein
MLWTVVLVILGGALLLITPFVAGATLSNRHDGNDTPTRDAPNSVPASMIGYVAPAPSNSQLYFELDPLEAYSLPDDIEDSVIADDLTIEFIRDGSLPPADIFPVDVAWTPWGYELPSDERRYPLQLELEMSPSPSPRE